ncbi:hypothetical protein ACFLZ6_02140 [Nanoarchaeota archaeon]
MGEQEDMDDLAKALVKQGLAASYADGLDKAKNILGIKEVIERKRKDFLKESEVNKEVEKMITPQKEETRSEMVQHIKEEVAEVKEEVKEVEQNPQPEKVDFIKERVEDIKEEVKVVEKH